MPGATHTTKAKSKPSLTRPIKSKRDYQEVMGITQRLLAQPKRETAAERRLQALLEEMDRFEAINNDADDEDADAAHYGGPMRRSSDDGRDD
jgi:hypothetical protein